MEKLKVRGANSLQRLRSGARRLIALTLTLLVQRHELESENRKLKRDLSELRKSLSSENSHLMPPAPGSTPYSILLEQLASSNEELEMRKEEVLLLHSHMVRQDALKHRVGKTVDPVRLRFSLAGRGFKCRFFPGWARLQGSTAGEGVRLDLEVPSFSDVDR